MSARAESANSYKNGILAALTKAEISRLAPHLSPLTLQAGKTLLKPGEEVVYVYFLESGMASIVINMADGTTVETAIIGNEGVVGIPGLLNTQSMPTHTFIQIAGTGFRIEAQRLLEEYERLGALSKRLNRFLQAHLAQTAQIAACNRLHDIAERLARWLLMCHDCMDSDTFDITQEFLGHMLGAPRTTVTLAAGMLHKAGLVDYSRGRIHVRNRRELEKASCECYKAIRDESKRLGISFF